MPPVAEERYHNQEHEKIHNRISKTEVIIEDLKARVGALEKHYITISDKLDKTATREDMEQFNNLFLQENEKWNKNLWWLVKALIVVVAMIALATQGLSLPSWM